MFPEQNILRRPRRVVIESGWGKPVYQDMDTGEVSIGDQPEGSTNPADQALETYKRTRAAQGMPPEDQMLSAGNAAAITRPRTVAEEIPPVAANTPNTDTRPWKVGGSLETDPLKREQARIQAMLDNPTSSVTPTGAVNPPHPFSRKKAALLGALYGAGMAGQSGNLAAILSGAATGAGIGIANPRSIQEWRRRMEVDDATRQLGTQQKIALGQQQIESERAETRQRELAPDIAMLKAEQDAAYNRERIKVQRDAAEGRISADEANRKLRQLEYEERKRHNLATEAKGGGTKETYDVTLPDGSVVKATAGEAITAASTFGKGQSSKAAKLKEIEDTKANAEIYEGNAQTNDQLADAEPKVVNPLTGKEEESDRAKDLREKAKEFRSQAAQLRGKIPGLQADAAAIPETSPRATGRSAKSGKYAGQRISRSRLPEAAKRLGMTAEQAQKYLTDEGAVIY